MTRDKSLGALLERADRRLRTRAALDVAVRAFWPALVVAVILTAAWRLTGYGTLAVAATGLPLALCVGLLIWLPFGFRRRNPLRAAAALDRRAGLEAAFATGFEVRSGRIAGAMANAALAEAERQAARLAREDAGGGGASSLAGLVPILPRGARFLAVPLAVLAGLALVPGGARPGGEWMYVLVPAGAAGGGGEDAEGRRGDPETRAPRADRITAVARERNTNKAIAAYKARERAADAPPPLPATPRAGAKRRPRRAHDEAAGRGADSRTEGGTGDAELDAGLPELDVAGPAGSGPVDAEESAVIQERFPEYGELIRRYFTGPRG